MALLQVGKLNESLASNARTLELDPEHLDARSRALCTTANFFSRGNARGHAGSSEELRQTLFARQGEAVHGLESV